MRHSLLVAFTFLFSTNSVTSLHAEEISPVPTRHEVVIGTSPQFVIDAKNHIHVLYEAAAPQVAPKTTPQTASQTASQSTSQSASSATSLSASQATYVPTILSIESTDNGKTWTEPVNVSKSTAASSQSTITLEKNGALDAAWCENIGDELKPDVFFARSVDGGKTWSKPVDVSTTPGESSYPSIAVASDNSLHLVWCDTSKGERNRDIYYASSSDGGKSWGKDSLLPAEDISNTAGFSSEPKIAIDDNDEIHVVWCDSTPGRTRPDIFYVYKFKGHWTKPQNLSSNDRISSHPAIACGPNGKVYLVWSDTARELHLADVWCSVGTDGSFGKPINISNTAGVSTQPTIAADETGRVAVIWSDICIEDGKPEVYARVSHDKAASLSHLIDMSNTKGSSKYAQVAINRDRMFVIWEEDDGGRTHIMISSIIF